MAELNPYKLLKKNDEPSRSIVDDSPSFAAIVATIAEASGSDTIESDDAEFVWEEPILSKRQQSFFNNVVLRDNVKDVEDWFYTNFGVLPRDGVLSARMSLSGDIVTMEWGADGELLDVDIMTPEQYKVNEGTLFVPDRDMEAIEVYTNLRSQCSDIDGLMWIDA